MPWYFMKLGCFIKKRRICSFCCYIVAVCKRYEGNKKYEWTVDLRNAVKIKITLIIFSSTVKWETNSNDKGTYEPNATFINIITQIAAHSLPQSVDVWFLSLRFVSYWHAGQARVFWRTTVTAPMSVATDTSCNACLQRLTNYSCKCQLIIFQQTTVPEKELTCVEVNNEQSNIHPIVGNREPRSRCVALLILRLGDRRL
jgi:hypothetical protein